jgi:hypothetical protein
MLRKNNDYEEFAALPKCWRTVMRVASASQMKTDYVIEEWGTAEESQRYVYVGIEKRLDQHQHRYIPDGSRCPDDDPPHYEIAANFDGATFTQKGVMKDLWPMQIQVWAVSPAGFGKERRVLDCRNPTHIVGMHHAKKKPVDFCRYLKDFAVEVKKLSPKNNDVDNMSRTLTVTLVACICDGPAREYCKCITGMLSQFPCEKCFSIGEKFGTNCMSNWKAQGLLLRTDESFLVSTIHVRSLINEETGELEPIKSPLRDCPDFGMVTGFPLEPMHTVYHGGVKNWFLKLFEGSQKTEQALSNAEKILMDRRFDFVRHFTPAEFSSSRVKPLDNLTHWKAAEMRHFLLYLAVIVFKGIVPRAVYEKLTNLLVALYFIGGAKPEPVPELHLQHAQTLLEKFVHEVARDHFRVSLKPSVHWMLHVVNDVRHFGCEMERLGAWPYESNMRFMMNSVKSGHRALEQILNREDEWLEFKLEISEDGTILTDLDEFSPDNVDRKHPYVKENKKGKKTLKFPKYCGDFLLNTTKNNVNCHFIYNFGPDARRDVAIVKFLDVFEHEVTGRLMIKGQQYLQKECLFMYPCKSDRFYGFKFFDLSPRIENFEVGNVVGKMYAVPCIDEIRVPMQVQPNDVENVEKNKLLKYLAAPQPKNAPQSPPAPDFRELCKAHFDAWEGMAIQHTYKRLP